MIRHIIAGISVVLALWAFVYMWSLDKEIEKLNHIDMLIQKSKIEVKKESVKDIKSANTSIKPINKSSSQNKEMEQKLTALKNKAGNIAAFEVSPLYKKKCSSCHGNIGEGIIGPKLMGKDESFIFNNLKEFKSGKRKNYVMYGLLGSMDESQLKELAKEISTFQAKLDATKK